VAYWVVLKSKDLHLEFVNFELLWYKKGENDISQELTMGTERMGRGKN
jgi:hypothetical protein